jgi:hypothetical protein
VDRSTVCRLSHSATVTIGARGTSRTCLSGFSDRRVFDQWARNGLPGKLGGRGGNSTQTTLGFSVVLRTQRLEPCQIRTGFSGSQIRHIAIYAYMAQIYGAEGANRTLIGCLPCNCSPIELHRLEPEGYSKPRPPRSECGALPLELLRRGASVENRTPLVGQAIDAQPIGHTRRSFWSGRR